MYYNHNLKITIYDLTLFEFDKKAIIYFEKLPLNVYTMYNLKQRHNFKLLLP